MKIELIQGDTSETYKFRRTDGKGEVIKTLPQKMWITFKTSTGLNEAVIQKTLDNGITYSEEDNYYRFMLESKDTSNLPYGEYIFDIAVINEKGHKKTLKKNCILEITDHCTNANNEV